MKKKRLSVLLSGLVFFMLLSVWTGCDSEYLINVTMINGSAADVHMWTSGESIDPSNKLAPGASRSSVFDVKDKHTNTEITITVYAGQNGQVLTSREFTRLANTGSLTVRYTGGTLVED